MSQELRDYDLIQVDNRYRDQPNEARRMSITATVGPTDDTTDNTRGVQITLDTDAGYAYARVSEDQIRDLLRVLQSRINPDSPFEATLGGADRLNIRPNGSVAELERLSDD